MSNNSNPSLEAMEGLNKTMEGMANRNRIDLINNKINTIIQSTAVVEYKKDLLLDNLSKITIIIRDQLMSPLSDRELRQEIIADRQQKNHL
jgi:hypothetical protein